MLDTSVIIEACSRFSELYENWRRFEEKNGRPANYSTIGDLRKLSASQHLSQLLLTLCPVNSCVISPGVDREIDTKYIHVRSCYTTIEKSIMRISMEPVLADEKERVEKMLIRKRFALCYRHSARPCLSETDVEVIALAYYHKESGDKVILVTSDEYMADAAKALGIPVLYIRGLARTEYPRTLEDLEKAIRQALR